MEFIENVTRFYTTEKFEEFDHDTLLPVTGDQHPLAVIAEDIYHTLSNTVITPPGEEDIPTPTMDLPEKDTFLTNMEQLLVGETLRINTVYKNDQHYALIEKVDDNHILFFNGPYSKSSYKTKDIDETDNYILAVETIYNLYPTHWRISNLLHKPFQTAEEALEFIKTCPTKKNHYIELVFLPKAEAVSNQWFRKQMRIQEILEDHPELNTPELYSPLPNVRFKRLRNALHTSLS